MQCQLEAARKQAGATKTLISAEAKKLLIKNIFNSLNDTQKFIAYFYPLPLSLGHLFVPKLL